MFTLPPCQLLVIQGQRKKARELEVMAPRKLRRGLDLGTLSERDLANGLNVHDPKGDRRKFSSDWLTS